jgi:hypothetical protein
MRKFRAFGGVAAMLAVSAMALPAQAQSRRGDGGRRHHHHHREDKVDAGGLILGALLVGGLFAASSAAKKKREREAAYFEDYQLNRERDATYREDYQAQAGDAGVPEGGPTAEPQGSPVADIPAPDAAEYDGLYDQDAAADRCAVAAETQAQQFARLARVTAITDNIWNGRSWIIKGWLEVAESYNQAAKPRHKFRCALRAGSEPVLAIEGLAAI